MFSQYTFEFKNKFILVQKLRILHTKGKQSHTTYLVFKVRALAKVTLNGQKEITRELAMDHGACFSLYVMHFADKYV